MFSIEMTIVLLVGNRSLYLLPCLFLEYRLFCHYRWCDLLLTSYCQQN